MPPPPSNQQPLPEIFQRKSSEASALGGSGNRRSTSPGLRRYIDSMVWSKQLLALIHSGSFLSLTALIDPWIA